MLLFNLGGTVGRWALSRERVVQKRARKPDGWLQAHGERGEEMIAGQK